MKEHKTETDRANPICREKEGEMGTSEGESRRIVREEEERSQKTKEDTLL